MKTCKNCEKEFIAMNSQRLYCAPCKEKVKKGIIFFGKAAMRFGNKSLYDLVANDKKTNIIEFFERNLTYQQAKEINVDNYKCHFKKYERFRILRVIAPKEKIKVEKNIVKSAKCENCDKVFTGNGCELSARNHVLVYGHKVTFKSSGYFKPKKI